MINDFIRLFHHFVKSFCTILSAMLLELYNYLPFHSTFTRLQYVFFCM